MIRVSRCPLKPPVKYGAACNRLEKDDQEILATWLDMGGYIWYHPGNELVYQGKDGKPNFGWIKAARKRGLKPGMVDALIFGKRSIGGAVMQLHIAIELKRLKGGHLSDDQRLRLEELRECGWHAEVCAGAQAAIDTVRVLTLLQGVIS